MNNLSLKSIVRNRFAASQAPWGVINSICFKLIREAKQNRFPSLTGFIYEAAELPYLLMLFKERRTVPFGSRIKRTISQITSARATTASPRNASLSISAAAGAK